jgi:hypothetical protein
LIFFLVLISILWVTLAFDRRCKSALKKWAKENGYELIKYEWRNTFSSPFPSFSFRQEWRFVYHFEIRDREGQIKIGWMQFREGIGIIGEPDKKMQIELVWDEN